MAIAAVALATNTYLTIRATLATATMAITMMLMMIAMTIFPFQQASALSTKIAMYNLHNLTRGPLTVRCIGAWRAFKSADG